MKLNMMTKFFSFNPGELLSIKFKIMASSSPIEEAISGEKKILFESIDIAQAVFSRFFLLDFTAEAKRFSMISVSSQLTQASVILCP